MVSRVTELLPMAAKIAEGNLKNPWVNIGCLSLFPQFHVSFQHALHETFSTFKELF